MSQKNMIHRKESRMKITLHRGTFHDVTLFWEFLRPRHTMWAKASPKKDKKSRGGELGCPGMPKRIQGVQGRVIFGILAASCILLGGFRLSRVISMLHGRFEACLRWLNAGLWHYNGVKSAIVGLENKLELYYMTVR
eukprot:897936-Amorphochlora_amoeboformis.AAC.1